MTGPEFRNRIMSILQSHIDAKEALDAEGNGRAVVPAHLLRSGLAGRALLPGRSLVQCSPVLEVLEGVPSSVAILFRSVPLNPFLSSDHLFPDGRFLRSLNSS